MFEAGKIARSKKSRSFFFLPFAVSVDALVRKGKCAQSFKLELYFWHFLRFFGGTKIKHQAKHFLPAFLRGLSRFVQAQPEGLIKYGDSIFVAMSATQLLNPKAESRVILLTPSSIPPSQGTR